MRMRAAVLDDFGEPLIVLEGGPAEAASGSTGSTGDLDLMRRQDGLRSVIGFG